MKKKIVHQEKIFYILIQKSDKGAAPGGLANPQVCTDENLELTNIRVAADREGAYIYVNGKKKTMTSEGYTSILLPEGEYEIKVKKVSEDSN